MSRVKGGSCALCFVALKLYVVKLINMLYTSKDSEKNIFSDDTCITFITISNTSDLL